MSIDHTTPAQANAPAADGRSKRNFVVVATVLLLAAVGLNAAVGYLQLHFKKEPVRMRASFKDALPAVVGNDWVQVARDENLDPYIKSALGTDEFLFCFYVKASAFNRKAADLQKELADKNVEEQRRLLHRLRQEFPKAAPYAIVEFKLTYYTGKADTVAHIPERCYIGGGYETTGAANEEWDLGGGRRLGVRRLTFEDQTGNRALPPQHVAYFFHVNGRYEHDSLRVRAHLQDLFARHGYYAKVELGMGTPSKPGEDDPAAWAAMREFLKAGLTHVEAALPDWSQYAAANANAGRSVPKD